MELIIHPNLPRFRRDIMIYGQFLEHFHRQVYGGIYCPGSKLADEDGFRRDVLQALAEIGVPVLRWPGGCFVSAYHWKNGVGENRIPTFDKAWRVEESNAFGTDEFIKLCKKLGCAPYLCTNAGTGTSEEMSDWVEYCNLLSQGIYAKNRIGNGYESPHNVRYWSIGNENYGSWEIGAKEAGQWGAFVAESAKMMRRVDPTISLSAAALPDLDWNTSLLKKAGAYLEWISIHQYWDTLTEDDTPASYEQCMAFMQDLEASIRKVRGLLMAYGLEKQIRISFDEWNLRGWHHPNIMGIKQGNAEEEYLLPRDKNDRNETYTMADAVFTACFLNTLLQNADIVGMANYSPAINTRGLLYVHEQGIVKRTTYYVYEMYTKYMGDVVLDNHLQGDNWLEVRDKRGEPVRVACLDTAVTIDSATGELAISIVNKHPQESQTITLQIAGGGKAAKMYVLKGNEPNSYNDVDRTEVQIQQVMCDSGQMEIAVMPHSVNVVRVKLG
ncbi:MAG: alpha-N-arabinofuranosidase [Clostridiales bacterium]|nr:alpha-N-arabinofuranosidase [Clostridiales bacterium]